ncbi:unnamed protein product [Owenia fusiformis]|uniref:Uncharacterized protein n=1 Tax=Owenia fusiformis TaxID=6347 RepID=A0A8S4PHQ2_OWEFU|nr:unnamed protein product [Owenia fusiformis]
MDTDISTCLFSSGAEADDNGRVCASGSSLLYSDSDGETDNNRSLIDCTLNQLEELRPSLRTKQISPKTRLSSLQALQDLRPSKRNEGVKRQRQYPGWTLIKCGGYYKLSLGLSGHPAVDASGTEYPHISGAQFSSGGNLLTIIKEETIGTVVAVATMEDRHWEGVKRIFNKYEERSPNNSIPQKAISKAESGSLASAIQWMSTKTKQTKWIEQWDKCPDVLKWEEAVAASLVQLSDLDDFLELKLNPTNLERFKIWAIGLCQGTQVDELKISIEITKHGELVNCDSTRLQAFLAQEKHRIKKEYLLKYNSDE